MNLKQTLSELNGDAIDKKYTIQGFDVNGFSAMVHVIEHFSYHTGQITLLTKWLTNKNTEYYGGLNLDQTNNLN